MPSLANELIVEVCPDQLMLTIRQRAACADMDTNIFFPARGHEANAKAICMVCPVRVECLAHALVVHEREAVLGATAEKDRRKLLRRMRATSITALAMAETYFGEQSISRCPPACRGNCPRCKVIRGSRTVRRSA